MVWEQALVVYRDGRTVSIEVQPHQAQLHRMDAVWTAAVKLVSIARLFVKTTRGLPPHIFEEV